jgi:hypothetical protein
MTTAKLAIAAAKQAILSPAVLVLPHMTNLFTVIVTGFAHDAVLMQDDGLVASRKLTGAECNYHTTDRELLAVIKVWRCYSSSATWRALPLSLSSPTTTL